MLVKNDEYFAPSALQSVLDFCDEIIVLDNMSEDTTYKQLHEMSDNYPKIRLK
jgi:glycosyltransferase involved in cell wall biosynthesis